jgi:hypothetical protein
MESERMVCPDCLTGEEEQQITEQFMEVNDGAKTDV